MPDKKSPLVTKVDNFVITAAGTDGRIAIVLDLNDGTTTSGSIPGPDAVVTQSARLRARYLRSIQRVNAIERHSLAFYAQERK